MEKVTAFILRNNQDEILLFQHKDNSIQLPAGTVEQNETIEEALYREIFEETGILKSSIHNIKKIPIINNDLANNELVIEKEATIFSEACLDSFAWGNIRKGITVNEIHRENGFIQIDYTEYQDEIKKEILNFRLLCWIKEECISSIKTRHYYYVYVNEQKDNWTKKVDNTVFNMFWHKIEDGNICTGIQNNWFQLMADYLHPTIPST